LPCNSLSESYPFACKPPQIEELIRPGVERLITPKEKSARNQALSEMRCKKNMHAVIELFVLQFGARCAVVRFTPKSGHPSARS
jgi:hypothetical protein